MWTVSPLWLHVFRHTLILIGRDARLLRPTQTSTHPCASKHQLDHCAASYWPLGLVWIVVVACTEAYFDASVFSIPTELHTLSLLKDRIQCIASSSTPSCSFLGHSEPFEIRARARKPNGLAPDGWDVPLGLTYYDATGLSN